MIIRRALLNFLLVASATFSLGAISSHANAATAEDLNKDADQALQTLYKTNPVAADISKKAKSVLVFPKVIKAGLIFGGSYGEGVLTKDSNQARCRQATTAASQRSRASVSIMPWSISARLVL